MSDERRVPEATELIYVPEPSWRPVLVAFGITFLALGAFAGWVYAVAGAFIAVVALQGWVAKVRLELSRMPREQRPVAAVLPVIPPISRDS